MKKDRLSIIIISIIILLGLSLRLFIAWQDISVLLFRCIPDDSFMVFRIAQEIARGHGLTFDGVIPSNSPRLIWELILSIIFLIYPQGGALPINIILTIASIADVGTVLMIFLILMKLLNNRFVALWGAGLYAFLPYAILRMNNGLETSLGIFLVMLTIYLFIKFYKEDKLNFLRCFIVGLLCGVIILTRMDYGILLIFLMIFMTFLEGIDRRYKKILITLLGSLVLLIPWLIWSYIKFGYIVPTSSYVPTYFAHKFYSVMHLGDYFSESLHIFYKGWKYFAFPFFAIRMFYFGPILFFLIMILGIYSLIKIEQEKKSVMSIELIPLIMTFILLIIHGLIGLYIREWHTGPSFPGTVILIAFMLYTISMKVSLKVRRIIFIMSLLITIPILYRIGYREWKSPLYPYNISHYKVSIWVRNNLPEDAIIGSFDGGIPAYFTHRRVVDLSGLENKPAFIASVNHKLGEYIDEEGIEYFLSFPYCISDRFTIFWGEDIKKRLVGPLFIPYNDESENLYSELSLIYKIIPRAEVKGKK